MKEKYNTEKYFQKNIKTLEEKISLQKHPKSETNFQILNRGSVTESKQNIVDIL